MVVGGAAIFPVVVVIRHQVRVDVVFFQLHKGRVIEWLVRPPGAMQKVVSTGMHFTSRWHTRHTADIVVVECDGPFRKTGEIWRKGPVATVVRQHVTVQRVVHNQDSFNEADLLKLCDDTQTDVSARPFLTTTGRGYGGKTLGVSLIGTFEFGMMLVKISR